MRLIFIPLLLVLLGGRSGAQDKPKAAAAGNEFAFALYAKLLQEDGGKNVFVSPFSVSTALAMTMNGAAGATRDEMAATLALKGDANAAFAELLKKLASADPKVTLEIANSLWARQGVPFVPAFLEANRKHFGAEAEALDFSAPGASARINGWVDRRTKGKIKEIVPATLPDESILYLINAVYFKGAWKDEFDPKRTQSRDFKRSDGSVKKHPIMFRDGDYRQHATADFNAVRLPYGKGDRSAMYLFVPSGTLKDFHRLLTAANWRSWMEGFGRREADCLVGLPRFRMEYAKSLGESLKSLGMPLAFDSRRADFSAMTPAKEVCITSVEHKTFVEVNEEGTEAAAATAVGVGVLSVPPQIIADRPFFFAIVDEPTSTILFMGSVEDPT